MQGQQNSMTDAPKNRSRAETPQVRLLIADVDGTLLTQ